MVKTLPCNAEDTGSIPGLRTKVPHAVGQLGLQVATTKPACHHERSSRCNKDFDTAKSINFFKIKGKNDSLKKKFIEVPFQH